MRWVWLTLTVALCASPFVFVASFMTRLERIEIPAEPMVRMPCAPTVEIALARGGAEDDSCALYEVDGVLVYGPLWFK